MDLGVRLPAGQQITNGWSANWSQSGSHVTVTSWRWNSHLSVGGSVTVGFNATHGASNPAPTSFALGGVTCTTS